MFVSALKGSELHSPVAGCVPLSNGRLPGQGIVSAGMFCAGAAVEGGQEL